MPYVNIEAATETAIITAINAAIALDAGLVALGIAVRGCWTDDVAAAADTAPLPLVGVVASPNVPYGYHGAKRKVPVSIGIFTRQADDRDRASAKLIYDCVRNIMDTATLTSASLSAIAIEIVDSEPPTVNNEVNVITLAVNAQVAV